MSPPTAGARPSRSRKTGLKTPQRRDFRINALYADASGQIHDPTGGGVDDARAGRVIFIGDAHARLREDYLRILRFFRFNAWYAKGPVDPRRPGGVRR